MIGPVVDLRLGMATQSELVSPAILAEMKAELESLSRTEPGAREIAEVVAELMPLIRGCRDRGHSWKRISEALKKFHADLTLSRLKRLAFELDPSLKGNSGSTKSLIPEMDEDEINSNGLPDLAEDKPKSKVKASKALDFEDDL